MKEEVGFKAIKSSNYTQGTLHIWIGKFPISFKK